MSACATGYMLTHGASIATAWKFLLALGAGAGLVFILRWYWWRINAWSEIAAMTAAATISLTLESRLGMPVVRLLHRIDPALALAPLNQDDPHAFAWLMLTTTALTTAIWLAVTLLTRPESEPTLQAFYDRVRPAALGWRKFAIAAYARDLTAWNQSAQERHPERGVRSGSPASSLAGVVQRGVEGPRETPVSPGVAALSATELAQPREPQNPQHDPTLRYNFFHWVLGFTLIYSMLFGLGDLLFGRLVHGCALIALSLGCLGLLFWSLNRRGWSVWK
jgi:hypothetical protein